MTVLHSTQVLKLTAYGNLVPPKSSTLLTAGAFRDFTDCFLDSPDSGTLIIMSCPRGSQLESIGRQRNYITQHSSCTGGLHSNLLRDRDNYNIQHK